jgi:hypothetical protein
MQEIVPGKTYVVEVHQHLSNAASNTLTSKFEQIGANLILLPVGVVLPQATKSYEFGSLFENEQTGNIYILARSERGATLVNIRTGSIYHGQVNTLGVSESELSQITAGSWFVKHLPNSKLTLI